MDFKVELEKVDTGYDFHDITRAIGMLNDLIDHVKAGAYREGSRNNIAVDLSILCYVVGLDPLEVGGCYLDWNKLNDLTARVEVIKDYLEFWDRYDIFQFMLMDWEEKYDLGYIGIVR